MTHSSVDSSLHRSLNLRFTFLIRLRLYLRLRSSNLWWLLLVIKHSSLLRHGFLPVFFQEFLDKDFKRVFFKRLLLFLLHHRTFKRLSLTHLRRHLRIIHL